MIAALKAAREIGVVTIGFTGTGGVAMKSLCDLMLVAPSNETAQIVLPYVPKPRTPRRNSMLSARAGSRPTHSASGSRRH